MVCHSTILCVGFVQLFLLNSIACFPFLHLNEIHNVNQDSWPPMPIEDYIKQFGYPLESHEIKTEDDYLLTYHRIPCGKNCSGSSGERPVVIVQHGLMAGSTVWVMTPNALGYVLADAGFDVWLGNARGNTYSRRHAKLDPEKDARIYWDFSWHEMGYYDLPASIDYILNITKRDKLFYIGHSMGTTMYFVLGATRPEYMDKVEAMVAMAPVGYISHINSTLAREVDKLQQLLEWVLKVFGIYYILPYSYKIFWLDQHVCANPKLQFLCRKFIFSIAGYDEEELDETSLPKILEYLPTGVSTKTLTHYGQTINNGFNQFDYGFMGNMYRYGSASAPSYNLTNVRAPMYGFYSLNDLMAVPKDVNETMKHFPNVKRMYKVADDKFNHIDYMWAIDAKTLVYDIIISIFKPINAN